MNDTLEKIKKLKEIYTQPQDQRRLSDLEKSLVEKIKQASLCESPVIKAIIENGQKKIGEISDVISWDDTLTEVQRTGLFREREAHMFWVKQLSGEDTVKSIASITKAIDAKLGQ